MHSCNKFLLPGFSSRRVVFQCDHSVLTVKALYSPWDFARSPARFSSKSADDDTSPTLEKPKRESHSWTAADDAKLRQADKEGLGSVLTCKKYFPSLDLSPAMVLKRRRKLGLIVNQLRWSQADLDLLRKGYNEGLTDLEMVATHFPTRTKNAIGKACIRLGLPRKGAAGRKTLIGHDKKWSLREDEVMSEGISLGKSVHTLQKESFPDRTYDGVKLRRRILEVQAHYKAGKLPSSPLDQRILTLHSQGLAVQTIALQIELSDSIVKRCLKHRGIPLNKPVWARTRWSATQDAKLLELDNDGTQILQMAKVLGTTQTSIRGRLRKLRPKDELRSMSQEDQRSAVRLHEEGLSFIDIAEHLQKRLHNVVAAITMQTGKPVGGSPIRRPWQWGHVPRGRTTSSHNGATHDDELESSQKGSI